MSGEKEKMLRGDLYDPRAPELCEGRRRARDLCRALNDSRDEQAELRAHLTQQLFAVVGEEVWIEPPFFCDYGSNIRLGRRVFFNFNCIILDPALVEIGDNVLFGPAVQVYTATHPLDVARRRGGLELARPIEVGADVWVGGGAILCPGVKIGPGSVIGAGSVVTRDVPPGVLAAGNPCRVIRPLTEQDR